MNKIYLYILVAFVTVYLIRVLPILVFKKPIHNKFIKSFLFYVPYVTLSVMTVPAIFFVAQDCVWAGGVALIVGIITAYFSKNLFVVSAVCCVACYLMQVIL